MGNVENVYRSRKKMLLDNFLGGIVWALGVWIGTTFAAAIIIYFLSQIDLVPLIGDFLAEVTRHAARQSSPFNF